ncbi:hypothetical protein GQ600_26064 [Phytophthora cactorum]|nr:hypothetical protein GQ600_26064 [Phytophthora cactorum]
MRLGRDLPGWIAKFRSLTIHMASNPRSSDCDAAVPLEARVRVTSPRGRRCLPVRRLLGGTFTRKSLQIWVFQVVESPSDSLRSNTYFVLVRTELEGLGASLSPISILVVSVGSCEA